VAATIANRVKGLAAALGIALLAGACGHAHGTPATATAPSAVITKNAPPSEDRVAASATPSPAPVASATVTAPPEEPSEEPVAEPPADASSPPPIAIHKGTRVLMFGDSMVQSGLGFHLEKYVVARGGKFIPATKANATTLTWATGRELQDLLDRVRPDVVIIALASNELFVPNPRARVRDVKKIVERIGARPCVWIGPAPWLPEKGILGVVRESSTPCRYFESSGLVMERQPDGIHPTLRGGKTWAEAVWKKTFASPE
jgi:lysophospholipase L1-like esterase